MRVDADRLRADLEGNAAHGALDTEAGHGRTVLCGTAANQAVRERFVERLEAAGLAVRVDAVGNIAGRWTPPSADPDAAPVASGSHLDSVPEGGIFDGPLGVYGALEAVRAMQAADLAPSRPIEVIAFTEEEGGRFGSGLLGSSVAVGQESPDRALARRDAEGRTLDTALADIGFRGEGRLDATNWEAWVELHIEQSSRLDDADVPVGVVTDIAGITHTDVRISGDADHAGATPMGDRTDALAAAAEFVLDVEGAAQDTVAETSETAVGTIGRLDVVPNATNVVPGAVELGLDVRDTNPDGIEAVLDAVSASLDRIEVERGVTTTVNRHLDRSPQPMSSVVREAAWAAAARADLDAMDLHSGAAHDSMLVASVTDAGMLFAPSRDGISHSPREWTDWADCAAATRVLAGTLAELADAT